MPHLPQRPAASVAFKPGRGQARPKGPVLMSEPTLPDGYYAIPDPDDAATMTYWRAKDGGLHPHPAKAWYGPPRPLRKDAPGPKGCPEFQDWMRTYFDQWMAWVRRVRDELGMD